MESPDQRPAREGQGVVVPHSEPPYWGASFCNWHGPDCQIPWATCHCGCGQATTVYNKTARNNNRWKGVPARYLRGHGHRVVYDDSMACPYCRDGQDCPGYGLCHCGCGEPTHRSKGKNRDSSTPNGWFYRTLSGHNNRALDPEVVADARRRYIDGEVSQADIARELGVSPTVVNSFMHFDTYRHAGVARREGDSGEGDHAPHSSRLSSVSGAEAEEAPS